MGPSSHTERDQTCWSLYPEYSFVSVNLPSVESTRIRLARLTRWMFLSTLERTGDSHLLRHKRGRWDHQYPHVSWSRTPVPLHRSHATVKGFLYCKHSCSTFMDQLFLILQLPVVLPSSLLFLFILLLGLTIYRKPWDSAISIGIMAAGVPAYLFGVRWRNKPKWLRHGLGECCIIVLARVVPA